MSVCELIARPEVSGLHCDSSKFWILVKALGEFVAITEELPLRGSIPDMTADSNKYIELQTIFVQKASEDLAVSTQ